MGSGPISTSRGGRATCSPRWTAIPSSWATPISTPSPGATRHPAHRGGAAHRRVCDRLIGCRAGANLRSAIAKELPGEVEPGHAAAPPARRHGRVHPDRRVRVLPLGRHFPEIRERFAERARRARCVTSARAFATGRARFGDGTISRISHNTAHPGPLADPADPAGWHELDDHPEIAMRRARRIDVWDEDGVLGIDAMFRDSAWDPDGSRSRRPRVPDARPGRPGNRKAPVR